MTIMTELLQNWNIATGALKPGTQRVFLDALQLVADGKTRMSYGMNYSKDNIPCLVNTVRPMILQNVTSETTPTDLFGDVVKWFDEICSAIDSVGSTTYLAGPVTEIMAETLVRNFGELKSMPEVSPEPITDDLIQCWLESSVVPYTETETFPKSHVNTFYSL